MITRFHDRIGDPNLRREEMRRGVVHVYCPHHGNHLGSRTEDVTHANEWAFEWKRDSVTGKHEYVRWEADGGECPKCKEARR